MLFISAEDFFARAYKEPRLTREEEKQLAREMGQSAAARERLIKSYYPMVASCIQRAPREIQTPRTVYICLKSLEEGVDHFNFLQDGETFTHHLSWRMRQCITRCIADRP